MVGGERPDPVRATLLAILQQLNRAESINEGVERDRALEVQDLQRLLRGFWAVEHDGVKLPIALGLLLRNGMVRPQAPSGGGRGAPPAGKMRYRITPEGKQFLVEAQVKTDRIPSSR